ncbi:hypothetical protein RhiirA5_445198 [Rhizophagus irregularis]|uniref:Uncharacterized protein n=1 Tax=Rhizophagus irregularis TaxID=588596 RepID=A0A2N0NCK1_9GLOM|nr:hypothetical protein RhiirA5_445198 [Rhizophagus irregularis]
MLVKDDKMGAQKAIQGVKFEVELYSNRRCWFKELIYYNSTKIDLMLLDSVKDCFVNSNGGVFRVKNYLKILPTYKVLWNRKVWGISSNKCPRCSIETETWEHIWICGKNDVNNTEYEIFVEEVLNKSIV